MGEIHLALDHQLGRQVALKFPRLDHPDQEFQIMVEARCQAAIQHPNVVPVHEVGILDGRACIVMAYINGQDLMRAKDALPLNVRVGLLSGAARGVQAAHRAGLIHRDLKPENILVDDRDGEGLRAYVTDFGLARTGGKERGGQGGPVEGTLAYMAPEQVLGNGLLDAPGDVYSLGAVLYALATDRPPFLALPFPGPLDSEPRLLSQDPPGGGPPALEDLAAAPPRPRALVPALPADLETIILHAMEVEPHRRYASAGELADDLDRFLAGEPIRARRPTLAYRLFRFAARNRALAALSLLGPLVLLAGAAAFLNQARVARERTILAQRYAMQAQLIEHHLRLGHMMPAHERTPHLVWARGRMEEMRGLAGREGAIAQGPFEYLAGSAHLLMDRPQEALAELERAWSLGFRAPFVAQALGEAVLETRHQEGALRPPSLARDGDVAKAFRYLKEARIPGTPNPLLESRIALLEGREDDAIAACESALRQTPWAYEAHLQIGGVWLGRLWRAERIQDVQAFLGKAMEQFEEASRIAPSDPKPLLMKALAIRTLQRREVENGRSHPPALLREAIALCDRADRLDPAYARVFAERSLLRCVLISHRDPAEASRNQEGEIARMLADAHHAFDLDPGQGITQAALGWALNTQSEHAFRRRSPGLPDLVSQATGALRDLVQRHPLNPYLNRAYAYSLWNTVDLQQEAGIDPRPASREMLAHMRASLDLQTLRQQAQGDRAPEMGELGERLTYHAELERLWGDPAAARAALREGLALLEGLNEKAGLLRSLPFVRSWNLLAQAQLDADAGGDPGPALDRAAAYVAGIPGNELESAYNRIPRFLPCHRALLEAQQAFRRGRDPRPALRACRRAALGEAMGRANAGYPLYALVLAAVQEVRYALPRGLDASAAARQGTWAAHRLQALELRRWPVDARTGLAEFGLAHFRLVPPGPHRPSIDALKALGSRRSVMAGALFPDPAWERWLDPASRGAA
ncbi:hypothetical protein METEAL_10000 [Mesoterricola silvestris]|uniref:Protein kinase domain-containing protein n=2 Tax=Mesoterricola silvestris TaxID=2927979 RepID=A0AA48K837_9BACT|nr:hypothetical protein METEAL_10000 [Mesoterricola silvestris]